MFDSALLKTIFGRLTFESFPVHEPILAITFAVVVLLGGGVVAAVTRYKLWGWLWREWFTTVDHKKIGVMYIILGIIMLVRGFADALMMRAQQAMAFGANQGYLSAHHYDQLFTAHGTIMIFFVAIPLIVGVFHLPLAEADRNLIATVLFIVVALTDWADGYLARRLKMTSSFGAFLDPVADKFLVCAALLVLVHLQRADVFVALIIIGVALYLVNSVIPMVEWMKIVINAIVAILVLLFVLQFFGIYNSGLFGKAFSR